MPGIITVTTASLTTMLTTLANAKYDLGVTIDADDGYITSLINRASSVVADHCGRTFGLQSVTEIFRFGAGSYIGPSAQTVAPYGTPLAAQFRPVVFGLSPVWPSAAAVALAINENSDAVLTLGTDFDLDIHAGLAFRIRNGLRSWWGVPTVTAAYSAGWTLPNDTAVAGVSTLPGSVEEATISLVRNAYMRRGRDPSVILDLVEGVGRVGYAKVETVSGMTIDDALADVLQPYRMVAW